MELMVMEATTLFLASAVLLLSLLALHLYNVYWVRPGRILERLRRQGIRGPPRRFPTGNLMDMKRISMSTKAGGGAEGDCGGGARSMTKNYSSTLFPYFDKWRKDYGPVFIYSTGNIPALYVSDPDLVRDISLCVSLDLGKATHLQKVQEPLFGHGILKANGLAWAHQRKVISPEFFMVKVKGMVDLIVEAAIPLLDKWESKVDSEDGSADVVVDQDLRSFSADVISRACFGSNYSRGKDIFLRLRALQKAISNPSLLFKIPHLRFLPSKQNREVKKLVQEVRSLILKLVKERQEEIHPSPFEKDLLQSILESASNCRSVDKTADGFIVDNCKNIYFAGHDTATVSATWCLMLLAAHPDWQSRARDEVDEVCQGQMPDVHMLQRMKIVTMVIQETLRLFPPSPFVSRETFQDMRFGSLLVPRGTNIWIPIATMHHDRAIWGEDADEFNPGRFARGVGDSCRHPHAYIPFGLGARKCVGQNLAVVELKIVIALILSRFRLEMSPAYRHSPAFRLTVGPEFGLSLVLTRV